MSAGRRPRRRIAMVMLALYGISSAALGLWLAVAVSPGGLTGVDPTREGAGPNLAAAPVLPVAPGTPTAGSAAKPSQPVPSARIDQSARGQVVAVRPRSLILGAGRRARIVPVGVHTDGALVIPDNPSQVGWWTGGALIGDPFGGIVIAGHVDSAQFGIGVLADLKHAQVGQVVELTAGKISQKYRISSLRNIPQAQLADGTDAFRQDVPARLVLITCGGAFDRATHHYQDNLLIFADPVS